MKKKNKTKDKIQSRKILSIGKLLIEYMVAVNAIKELNNNILELNLFLRFTILS